MPISLGSGPPAFATDARRCSISCEQLQQSLGRICAWQTLLSHSLPSRLCWSSLVLCASWLLGSGEGGSCGAQKFDHDLLVCSPLIDCRDYRVATAPAKPFYTAGGTLEAHIVPGAQGYCDPSAPGSLARMGLQHASRLDADHNGDAIFEYCPHGEAQTDQASDVLQ